MLEALRDDTENAERLAVDPLGLVSKGTVWYLIADTEHGRRTFRVNRVRSVEVTDLPAVRPDGFDLRAAWQEVVVTVGERRLPVRATVRLERSYVHGLRAQFGDDMMLAELDGRDREGGDARVEVIVGGPSAFRIAQHLAGWGTLVEVVEPAEVCDHLARIGRELVQRYPGPRDPDPG